MDAKLSHSTAQRPESTVMIAWPSISANPAGRLLGSLFGLGPPISLGTIPFRFGWLLVPLFLPVAVALYFLKIVPRLPGVVFGVSNPFCRRYRLTTKRILVEHPMDVLSSSHPERGIHESLELDGFDSIAIEHLPGQEWYSAGDLIFMCDQVAVLRLEGVPHPESFRHTCLAARQSHAGVSRALLAASAS